MAGLAKLYFFSGKISFDIIHCFIQYSQVIFKLDIELIISVRLLSLFYLGVSFYKYTLSPSRNLTLFLFYITPPYPANSPLLKRLS